jgi:hypothetical protein
MKASSFITCLFLIQCFWISISSESESNSRLEVETIFGRNPTESHYLQVWETTCLSEIAGEISEDQKPEEEKTSDYAYSNDKHDLFAEINKKEYPLFQDIFEKVDIDPFFEAIMLNKSMNPADINFQGFMIFVVVFISITIITFILFCVFTMSRFKKKQLQHRDCCLKACVGITIIFIGVASLIGGTNFFFVSSVSKTENTLLCEATRIPHILFFGNPEIYLNLDKSTNFVGFETIRRYVLNFLNESESFVSGSNYQLLKDLEDIDIDSTVNELFDVTLDFFNHYQNKKITNSSGKSEKPLSISNDLPNYRENIIEMIDKYKEGGNRLDSIIKFKSIITDPASSKVFIDTMDFTHGQLLKIQQHLSIFWNHMLHSSFDGTLIFKLAVIAISIQSTLLLISSILVLFSIFVAIWNHRPIRKNVIRFLIVLVMLVTILSMGALFEISRGAFSTVYGCSVMYQLKESPKITKSKIASYFQKDKQISRIFDQCFLGDNEDHTQNFYNIFEEVNTQISLQQFLEFMDGIKMIHEDVESMATEYDTKYTESIVKTFTNIRSGITTDFDDIEPSLNKLNGNFDCTEIIYVLEKNQCTHLPPNKTNCIDVKTGEFESAVCVHKFTESYDIFMNLKQYMKDEEELMEAMLYKLDGNNNPKSILSLIRKTYLEFDMINKKVKSFDSKLDTHFSSLKEGPIETWLDCGVIQNEISKSFKNICTDKLEDITNYAQMNLAIILICYGSMIVFFISTFCLKDEKEFIQQRKNNEEMRYENMSPDEEIQVVEDGNQTDEDIEKDDLIEPQLRGKQIKKETIGL